MDAAPVSGFRQQIISMYARGMTVREIRGHLEELYGIEKLAKEAEAPKIQPWATFKGQSRQSYYKHSEAAAFRSPRRLNWQISSAFRH